MSTFPLTWGQPWNNRRFCYPDGPLDSDVMLVGEGPGKQEAFRGQSFVGPSGESLDAYLWRCSMTRGSVYVTNLVKYRVSDGLAKDEPPSPADIERDWPLLKWEIETVRPSTLIALGGSAARALTDVTHPMDALCGRPITPSEYSARLLSCDHIPDRVIGTIHPAAGLRDPDLGGRCYQGLKLAEQWISRGTHPFLFENERYSGPSEGIRLVGAEGAATMRRVLVGQPYIFMDTEGSESDPWCSSFAVEPGIGYVIYAEDHALLAILNEYVQAATSVLHSALHDLRVLRAMGIYVKAFLDTMVLAFLTCGEPQGLKGLAWRVAGLQMNHYEDVVSPYSFARAITYLEGLKEALTVDSLGIMVEGRKHSPLRRVKETLTRIRNKQALEAEADDAEGEESGDGGSDDEPVSPDKKLRKWWRGSGKSGFPKDWSALISDVYGPMPQVQRADVPDAELIPYSGTDADATCRVFPYLMKRKTELKLDSVFDTDMRVIPMLDDMQANGMPLSLPALFDLERELKAANAITTAQLVSMCGADFNPNSGDHVSNFLFGRLGVPPKKMTKSGKRPATDDKVMEAIVVDLLKACGGDPKKLSGRDADVHTFVKLEQDYREQAKLIGTFVMPLWEFYNKKTGCVHPNWRSTRVVSGRLATFDPNLLAFPARSDWGLRVRSCFVCPPGYRMKSFDLDQVEMRVMASESVDDALLSAFYAGQDVHWANAALIFHRDYDDICKWDEAKGEWVEREKGLKTKLRMPSKNIGFGVLYGITHVGLQAQLFLQRLDYTSQDCQDLIDSWYMSHPGVRKYLRDAVAETRRNGYVRDRWGRIRYLPGVWSELAWIKAEAERQAGNMKIQACAQGVIKRAMIRIQENVLPELRSMGYDVRALLQIHDELIFMYKEDSGCEEIMTELVLQALEKDSEMFLVPLTAKGQNGLNWGQLK